MNVNDVRGRLALESPLQNEVRGRRPLPSPQTSTTGYHRLEHDIIIPKSHLGMNIKYGKKHCAIKEVTAMIYTTVFEGLYWLVQTPLNKYFDDAQWIPY